ncbi:hypothetical protein CRD59_07485 [Bifidobacterium xylocopae]|uniref:ABC transporter Uup C-terminal domain-containing protein n=1 Tax=Bifidobacterium xylocopae TaxID=2493119 RepID=A0A366KC22_9BIFI|nr:hypothetical protein CRD59_07485 [Bifidobacterium xylocopae]
MEDLLDSWPGTLIVVSHDRYLLERVTDQQYALIGGKVLHLPGGVDDYLAMVESGSSRRSPSPDRETPGNGSTNSAVSVTSQEAAPRPGKSDRQVQRELNKRSRSIERKLSKLNGQVEDLQARMARHDPADYEGLGRLNEQVKAIQAEIGPLEEEWLEIGERLED